MRLIRFVAMLLAIASGVGAQERMNLDVSSKLTLLHGSETSIEVQAPAASLKFALLMPWQWDPFSPEPLFVPGESAFLCSFSSPIVEFGGMRPRSQGDLLCRPFAATPIGLGGKPFSVAGIDDASFEGLSIGSERGIFLLRMPEAKAARDYEPDPAETVAGNIDEKQEVFMGFWDSWPRLGYRPVGLPLSGIIGAIRRRHALPEEEWFGRNGNEGVATWTIGYALAEFGVARLSYACGHYFEIPGMSGSFARADALLRWSRVSLSARMCFSDGEYRRPDTASLPLYDCEIEAAVRSVGCFSLKASLRQQQQTTGSGGVRTAVLAGSFYSAMGVIDLASSLRTGRDEITLFMVDTRVRPSFLQGFSLGTAWQAFPGGATKFDARADYSLDGAFVADLGAMIRFTAEGRFFKFSLAAGIKKPGSSMILKMNMTEPWMFFPETGQSKVDVGLYFSVKGAS